MRASPQEVLARDAQRSCLCFQSQWDTALLSHSVLSHINVWYMHAASRLFSWSIELLIAASPHAAPKIEHGHLSVSRFAAIFPGARRLEYTYRTYYSCSYTHCTAVWSLRTIPSTTSWFQRHAENMFFKLCILFLRVGIRIFGRVVLRCNSNKRTGDIFLILIFDFWFREVHFTFLL